MTMVVNWWRRSVLSPMKSIYRISQKRPLLALSSCFPLPAERRVWEGGCAFSPENFSLLTLEKAHFGGSLMHSDVLILKLWFAVHMMLQILFIGWRIIRICWQCNIQFQSHFWHLCSSRIKSRIKLWLNLTIGLYSCWMYLSLLTLP